MKGELNFLLVKCCAAAGRWDVCHPYISVVRAIDTDVTGSETLHAVAEKKLENIHDIFPTSDVSPAKLNSIITTDMMNSITIRWY